MYFLIFCKAPPSPPQNLHVTNVTSKSVTIEWETPDSNGGTEITSYIIEKLLTKSSQWSRVATLDSYCLSYCIDNLKETTELSFRVLAENAIGISAPANTESITLRTHASTLNVVKRGERRWQYQHWHQTSKFLGQRYPPAAHLLSLHFFLFDVFFFVCPMNNPKFLVIFPSTNQLFQRHHRVHSRSV